MNQENSEYNDDKLLSWPRFYRLLTFFVILIPICYVMMEVYRALLVPFFLSLFFAYFLSPFVDRFDRFRISRVWVVTFIILFTFALVGFALFEVVPYLYVELINLAKLAPKVFDFVNDRMFPVLKGYLLELGFFDEQTIGYMVGQAQTMVQLSDRVQDALTSIWRSAPHVVGTLVNIVMTPLFTFFFVKDQKRIVAFLTELTPVDLRYPVASLLKRISRTLHSVIKGQILVAAVLGVLYVVGFSLAGVHAGFAIGLVAGLCRLIPYLDIVVGGMLCLIVMLANWQGFGQLFFVIGVFGVVQTLDGMLITPRIIGERLGVHPLVVIITVIGFADFWGFWGVLLAVPTIAILKVIFLVLRPYYENSRAYGIVGKESATTAHSDLNQDP
jgi:predicted PurR-regulated permease PerM